MSWGRDAAPLANPAKKQEERHDSSTLSHIQPFRYTTLGCSSPINILTAERNSGGLKAGGRPVPPPLVEAYSHM